MVLRWHWYWFILFFVCAPVFCRGGGSGLNVMVVANQNSTNSAQLANYYCERRQVPPQNVVFINWTGGNANWGTNDFSTYLSAPLQSAMATRQLTNQIDYVVLSMDIPYRVSNPDESEENGTTSALFYGFKTNTAPPAGAPDSCSLPNASSNSYAASEGIFRSTSPGSLSSNNVMAIMITHSNLTLAKQIVDQGVLGDGSFPTQTVFLSKSTDTARNVRYTTFDDAIFNTRLRGNYAMQITNTYGVGDLAIVLGANSGAYNFSVSGTAFVPGAMADNLTSYGGRLFEYNGDQFNLLAFLAAGASGSYGTVIEPCNYLEKFPSPQDYFYQSRGFSLAECYYQSITNPFEGILVGEPLSAPFAQSGAGAWNNLPVNALLSGATNLSAQFNSIISDRPLQQVDLFVDGLWFQTVTNIGPVRSNFLNVTINGRSMNYLVPLNATIKSVASNLTAVLNTSANSNVTKVFAYTHGDRIELQSVDRTKTGAQVTLSVSNSIGAGTTEGTFVTASRTSFLDTTAYGRRGFTVTGIPAGGSWLQVTVTKTNGAVISLGATNNSGWTLTQLAQALLDKINTNASPSLQGSDGLAGEDLVVTGFSGTNVAQVEFNLRARGVGWDAAQIQADLNASAGFTLSPSAAVKLDENVSDLIPRNHLYVSAGLTNLPAALALNTTSLPDGYHELAAVAYEGTHVRTQTRATQTVRIQNNPWSATLNTLVGGNDAAVEGTLQFSVVATTNAISKIELFSTGGSLTNILGQMSATFSVPGTKLGIGLHPFYAIVTATNGKQYRTDTKWIRLVGSDGPFTVFITPPADLTWPATAGRSYDVLSQTNLTNPFQLRATVTPSNSVGQWSETDLSSRQRFYRVRTAQ